MNMFMRFLVFWTCLFVSCLLLFVVLWLLTGAAIPTIWVGVVVTGVVSLIYTVVDKWTRKT